MRRVCVLAVGFALAALPAVALASVASGTYTGTESQAQSGVPYKISLTVSGNKITRVVYGANYTGHAPCPSDSGRWVVGAGIKGGKAIAITGNTINARNAKIGPGDVFTYFKGTFTGTTVQGSFDETFTAETSSGGKVHSYKCTSGKVTFTASSSPAS